MSEDFDKYLGIANHDIQMANNMGELKSYVADILYDNDKKVELLQQKENIIKEVREYINDNVMVYAFNDKKFPHWEFNDDNINDILEILDKGE